MPDHPGRKLQKLLKEKRGLLVPGAANALSARIIEDLGFEALYLTGAGITNMFLGVPDLGLISLPELVQHTAATRDVVELPIIVDGETGFGNAINVRHSVRAFERAGANAIQLEDQVMPKRCGHFAGKEIVSIGDMVGKIRAALDARQNEDFLIMARTDARTVDGFNAAVERCHEFIEAGADITFVEAPESIDEIKRIPELLAVPQVINMVVGGRTPIVDLSQLATMRFGMVLYANAALQGAIAGMQMALTDLKKKGRMDNSNALVATFQERQRLVRKPHFDELEKKYAAK